MSVASRGRLGQDVDLADREISNGRSPSPPRRERRGRRPPAEPVNAPALQAADQDRADSLLDELTRGTCQLTFCSSL